MGNTVNLDEARAFAEMLKQKDVAGTTAGLYATPLDPDGAVQAEALAPSLGVPPAAVLPNIDIHRRDAEMRSTNDLLGNSPALRAWLDADPINPHFSAGDLDNMSGLEAMFNAVARGGLSTYAALPTAGALFAEADARQIGMTADELQEQMFQDQYGDTGMTFEQLPAHLRVGIVTAAHERERYLTNLLAEAGEDQELVEMLRLKDASEMYARADELFVQMQDYPMGETAANFRDQTLANAENSFSGTLAAFMQDPIGGAAFLAQTAGESIPMMAAGTAATFLTGNPAAGATLMGVGSLAREQSSEVNQFLAEQGVDISTPEAAMIAITERPDILLEAQGRGLTRGVIIGLMDGLSGGVAGQQLAKTAGGNIILQAMVQGVMAGSGEAGAQMATDGEINPQEIVIEALAELVTLPIETLGVGGRMLSTRRTPKVPELDRLRNTGKAADFLTQIKEGVQQSATRERSPGAFEDFINKANEGGNQFYVDAAELRTYAQSESIPLSDFGVEEADLVAAEAGGGYVEIPTSVAASRIIGSEAETWFEQNTVLDPVNEMSLAEAARERQTIMQEAIEKAQAMRNEQVEVEQAERKVMEIVEEQIMATGQRSQEAAHNEALFFSAFFSTMSERYGGTPLGLYEQFNIQFAGVGENLQDLGENPSVTLEQMAQTPEFQQWFGDSKVVDEGGAPMVMYHGTPNEVSEDFAFDFSRQGETTDDGWLGQGVYFTPKEDVAQAYGSNTVQVYLSLQNPFTFPDDVNPIKFVKEHGGPAAFTQWVKEQGFDGIVSESVLVQTVAFRPDQIKSINNAHPTDDPRIMHQSAAAYQVDPLPVEGSGKNGKVKKQDVARGFTDLHMEQVGRVLDPIGNPEDYASVLDEMLLEYEEQLDQHDTGHGWYTADIARAIEVTTQIIPELADPAKRDLFMALAAVTSPRERPNTNWEKAIDAMQQYVRDGVMPERKQNGKQFGVSSVGTNIQLLQKLIAQFGEQGAVDWLTSTHTGAEMADVRRDSGLFVADKPRAYYTPNEMNLKTEGLGVYMFGPKVGDFFLNASGVDQDAVTVDMWLAQTYNRHIGRLLDVGAAKLAEGGVANELRTPAERETIKNLIRDAAAQAGIEPSAMQAALWYFEQRLERSHGLYAESQSFAGAAEKAAGKRGIEVSERGASPSGESLQDAAGSAATDLRGNAGGGDPRGAALGGPDVRQSGRGSGSARLVSPEEFSTAMEAAGPTLGAFAAQVSTVDPSRDVSRVLLDDGATGYALDGDNLIGVFSTVGASPMGAGRRVLTDAVARGARRLDGFDTFLPGIYAKGGFRAVARLPFDPEYAPARPDALGDWDADAMEAAHAKWGSPDVVFMVYDPENASADTDNTVATYEDGMAAQDEALAALGPRVLNQPGDQAFDVWAGEGYTELDPDEVSYNDFSEGGPWVIPMKHGTTHQIEEFDAKTHGAITGAFGRMNYFTTSENDAGGNYTSNGPDITNRIESLQERLEAEIDDMWIDALDSADGPEDAFGDMVASLSGKYDFDSGSIDDYFIDGDPDQGVDAAALAQRIASDVLLGGEDIVMDLWVRTERPFVVGDTTTPSPWLELADWTGIEAEAIANVADMQGISEDEVRQGMEDGDMEIEDAVTEERWVIMDQQGNPLAEALGDVAQRYDFSPMDLQQLQGQIMQTFEEGGRTSLIETFFRDKMVDTYFTDFDSGEHANTEIFAEVVRELGFDSIILQHADKRWPGMNMDPGTAHIMVFDENNVNIKSATDNEGTFDRTNPNIFKQGEDAGPRGTISIPNGGIGTDATVITLMESNNLSTIIHESGHAFYEMFNALASDDRAPQQMKDDLAALQEWMGVKPGEIPSTEAHEKMARGMERYALEGKAPSLELSSVFGRFRAWLLQIYKTATTRKLAVNMNDEVRGIFDRMLATDKQIAEAQDELGQRPMFADHMGDMDQQTQETYQKADRRRVETANQKLIDRTMASVRRTKETWWKEERAERIEATNAQMSEEQNFRAIEALSTGKLVVDEAEVEIPRLDRAALVQMFGEEVIADLNPSKFGMTRAIYTTTKNPDGVHPHEAAELLGYRDAGEMIADLRGTGNRREILNARVDQAMADEYGDPFTDGTIEAEAMEVIHNDGAADMLAIELRHIAAKRGADTRRMKTRIFKARAKAMIGAMDVAMVMNPNRFLTAERRAGKAAEKALAGVVRGNPTALAEAQQAKEQQLLNHYLYAEAREVERMVLRNREKMKRYGNEDTRKKIGSPHIEQIEQILDQYEFKKLSQRAVDRRLALAEYIRLMTEGGEYEAPNGEKVTFTGGRETELAIPEGIVNAVGRTHYTRLTVDELRGVFDAVANLDHVGRRTREVVIKRNKRLLDDAAGTVSGQILQNQKHRADPESRAGRAAQNFVNSLSRVDTIAVRMDGGEEMGSFHENIKRPIDEAQLEEQKMSVEVMEGVSDLFSKFYSKEQLRDMKVERQIGSHGSWTREQIIMIALNSGTESNWQRIMDPAVEEKQRMTQARVDALLGTLDNNDWRFAQAVLKFIDSYYGQVAEVNKRMTGLKPRKTEGQSMWAGAPAFFTGGYFRLYYDHRSTRSQESIDVAKQLLAGSSAGQFASAQVGNGMTKSRLKSAGGASVLLDFTSITRQLRETSRFITLAETVAGTQRILSHPDVTSAMKATGNSDTAKTLDLWLKDIASGPIYNQDWLNSSARLAKNNFTLSRLGFNIKTVLLQATGLTQAAVTIGPKHMAKGLAIYGRGLSSVHKDIIARDPMMAERMTTMQKDIYDFRDEMKMQGPVKGRWASFMDILGKISFEPIVRMQFHAVDVPTWLGAYEAALSEGKSEQDAIYYAGRMVARSQDSGMMADRSAVERGTLSETTRQSDVVRLLTTLGGFMLTKMNRANVQILRAEMQIKEADSPAVRMAIASRLAIELLVLYGAEAVIMGLMYEMWDDDDDWGDFGQFVAGETASTVVSGIPVVRDFAGAFRGFEGGVYGSITVAPANAYRQIAQGEIDDQLARNVLDLVGTTTGMPTTATYRIIEQFLGDDEFSVGEMLMSSNPLNR